MTRRMPQLVASLGLGGLLALVIIGGARAMMPAAANFEFTLRNDSWSPAGSENFVGGFLANEIAAARLTPPNTEPAQVIAVQFLFGGAVETRTITLHIWDDAALTLNPGGELFSANYLIPADDEALQVIDLSGENVVVTGTFRVGIEFSAAALPATAVDTDGLTPNRNFINTGVWFANSNVKLNNDWIIRAVVDTAYRVRLPLVVK
jgi:hypothetical protein